MSNVTMNLIVSEKIKDLVKVNGEKQMQATVPHETVLNLLQLAKLPTNTVISRKRGVQLDVTVLTPMGTEVTFRQGDTHSLWFSHQTDDNAKKLLAYAVEKGGASFPVKSVALIESPSKIAKQITADDMTDCPI